MLGYRAVVGCFTVSRPERKEDHMPRLISRFLTNDHQRLANLLQRSLIHAGEVDLTTYTEFRAGLLKHIGMEEKILLPAAQRAGKGAAPPHAAKLRLDHGALAALLVPTPTPAIIAALRAILAVHNTIEEGQEGVYELCEQALGKEASRVLAQLQAAPEVRVSAYTDDPKVFAAIRRALARAGYGLTDYELP